MKVTWWVEPSPTRTIARMSDQALLDTINVTRSAARVLRGPRDKLPAVAQMWQHHQLALYAYGALMAMELCNKRGSELDVFSEFNNPARELNDKGVMFQMPPWYTDDDVLCSHISAMTRFGIWKDDESKIVVAEVDEFWPVLWPIMTSPTEYDLMINKADRAQMAIDNLDLPAEVRARVVNLD